MTTWVLTFPWGRNVLGWWKDPIQLLVGSNPVAVNYLISSRSDPLLSGDSGSEYYGWVCRHSGKEREPVKDWLILGTKSMQKFLVSVLSLLSIAFDAVDQRVVLIHYKLTWNSHVLSSWGGAKIHFYLKEKALKDNSILLVLNFLS
jgi:hypothetical protein